VAARRNVEDDTAPEESAKSLSAARSGRAHHAADLPADLRAEWLAQPNVSALLKG